MFFNLLATQRECANFQTLFFWSDHLTHLKASIWDSRYSWVSRGKGVLKLLIYRIFSLRTCLWWRLGLYSQTVRIRTDQLLVHCLFRTAKYSSVLMLKTMNHEIQRLWSEVPRSQESLFRLPFLVEKLAFLFSLLSLPEWPLPSKLVSWMSRLPSSLVISHVMVVEIADDSDTSIVHWISGVCGCPTTTTTIPSVLPSIFSLISPNVVYVVSLKIAVFEGLNGMEIRLSGVFHILMMKSNELVLWKCLVLWCLLTICVSERGRN